jgi:excisionase family DNA binding protein
MEFPPELPEPFRTLIEDALANVRRGWIIPWALRDTQHPPHDFIFQRFLFPVLIDVGARQVRRAAQAAHWSIEPEAACLIEVWRGLTVDLYETHFSHEPAWSSLEAFRRELWPFVQASPEWRQHLEAMIEARRDPLKALLTEDLKEHLAAAMRRQAERDAQTLTNGARVGMALARDLAAVTTSERETREEGANRSQQINATSDVAKADTSRLLTIKKAAELLSTHEDTIRRMGKRGELEIITIGRRAQRIKASEILRVRNTPRFRNR